MTEYLVLRLPRPDAVATDMLNGYAADGWRVVDMTGGDVVVTVIMVKETASEQGGRQPLRGTITATGTLTPAPWGTR